MRPSKNPKSPLLSTPLTATRGKRRKKSPLPFPPRRLQRREQVFEIGFVPKHMEQDELGERRGRDLGKQAPGFLHPPETNQRGRLDELTAAETRPGGERPVHRLVGGFILLVGIIGHRQHALVPAGGIARVQAQGVLEGRNGGRREAAGQERQAERKTGFVIVGIQLHGAARGRDRRVVLALVQARIGQRHVGGGVEVVERDRGLGRALQRGGCPISG